MNLEKRLLEQVLGVRTLAAEAGEISEDRRRQGRVDPFERLEASRLIRRHEPLQLVAVHAMSSGLPEAARSEQLSAFSLSAPTLTDG